MTPRRPAPAPAPALALCLAALLAACGSGERARIFGGERAVELEIPAALDEDEAYPLVVVLHGYSVTGYIQQAYLGLARLTESSRAFVVSPTGTYNSQSKPFWNADEGCCDYERAGPDDVGYLAALIDEIAGEWPIDRGAVFAVGHGNGGNMAYRLACDRADDVAAIVVVAGGAAIDPAACAPARPVSVLHLHGTDDPEFAYEGGGPFQMAPGAPGAVESVTRWAGHDGCSGPPAPAPALDVDAVIPGAETRPSQLGCPPPLAVELWTMEGSDHLPNMVDTFVPAVWPWLEQRRRAPAR